MNEPFRDMCVLVRNIAETVQMRGNGCQVDVRAVDCVDGAPSCGHSGQCTCFEFISACAGPNVTLTDAVIEPSRTRAGACLRATLLVPVTLTVRTAGINRICRGEICIPAEGMMRSGSAGFSELVAQANVRICRGCYIDGRIRLWIDFHADVHAICQRAVRIPISGPCDTGGRDRCHPFFDLPLYPKG